MEFDKRLKVGQWTPCRGDNGMPSTMLLTSIGNCRVEIVGPRGCGVYELHKWSKHNDCQHFVFQIRERERKTPACNRAYSDKIVEQVNSFVKAYTMGLLDV